MNRIDRLRPAEQRRLLAGVAAALEAEAHRSLSWSELARPEQLPPTGPFRTWLIRAGRGWGKTRTGAETIAMWVREGSARRIAVVARTEADLRDVAMAALREAAGAEVEYIESRHLIRWPNGAEARGFSAEEPNSLRGFSFDTAWADELAAWSHEETWDQLQFALRMGFARQIVTTTPRPSPLIRRIQDDPGTILTTGSTFENASNLGPTLGYLAATYGGTRLGRQELEGELLDDVEGALWQRSLLDALRVAAPPDLGRTVVAVDPAVSVGPRADETGIIVVAKGLDGHGYVLADRSARLSPDGWARQAIAAYHEYRADAIITETNQGGGLVQQVIRTLDAAVPIKAVTATVGKRARAQPIAALYEQRRVHHVGGFAELEDQLCSALPDGGTGPDDRLDALVYGITELELCASGRTELEIHFAQSVWPCVCGNLYPFTPGGACPSCGERCPMTYDEPVTRPETWRAAPRPGTRDLWRGWRR